MSVSNERTRGGNARRHKHDGGRLCRRIACAGADATRGPPRVGDGRRGVCAVITGAGAPMRHNPGGNRRRRHTAGIGAGTTPRACDGGSDRAQAGWRSPAWARGLRRAARVRGDLRGARAGSERQRGLANMRGTASANLSAQLAFASVRPVEGMTAATGTASAVGTPPWRASPACESGRRPHGCSEGAGVGAALPSGPGGKRRRRTASAAGTQRQRRAQAGGGPRT